jgi:hypothetical protein
MTRQLLLEVASDQAAAFAPLSQITGEELTLVERKRFDGVHELVEVLVPLALGTLPFITKVLVELIKARQHVRILYDGIEIGGVTEETAERILANLLSKR